MADLCLYALVLHSRKPKARKFAKWVTSEVLPTIRKIGGYGDYLKTSEILRLTPHQPLFGHRSGKRSGTQWMAFIKDDTP